MRRIFVAMIGLAMFPAASVRAERPDVVHAGDVLDLSADVLTHHMLALPSGKIRFSATAGTIRLNDDKATWLANVAFIAYQKEVAAKADPGAAGSETGLRPVTFVFNGGPGMASAWLQMGAVGPWRIRLDPAAAGPSASPVPIANAETWLDFTDLVFIDPPGTGYSVIVAADPAVRRRFWSVPGDIDALAEVIRRWLDQSGRNASPKYILGESYGGFRGPRLVRKLQSESGVGISGLILVSPLLDSHVMSGYADPLGWVDRLPSEVASVRARHGPVSRADLADVESYAAGDYLVDILRGYQDADALDRLTTRVSGLTGLDAALVRRLGGRIDSSVFLRAMQPGQVSSAYDATITRPDPEQRALAGPFPDPVLNGFEAPVTSGMMAVYSEKLNWHRDNVYHLSNPDVAAGWDWGQGMGRPESISALQAARSLDPRLRVLIAHGMFDLVTPYFGNVRMLRLLPEIPGAPAITLRVYPGGHMFYFDDRSRAALHEDAKTVFEPIAGMPVAATEGSP